VSERAFYVTTPIYYVSGHPHIGHAYTTIAADVMSRVARCTRAEAHFLTGTDEHGQKIAENARNAGLEPQAFVDSLIPRWKALLDAYEISNDDFIRTTEPRHERAVQRAFEVLRERGDIYPGKYEGWYCTNDETFWPQAKLLDGRCPNPECRREVKWLSEDDWFFRLSAYNERLLRHFREHPQWVRPQRVYNEMVAILESGLEDISITRATLSWGIPVPGGEGVIYVWFDALLNYITAIGWGSDDAERRALFERLWPADVHLIGKEIARFHTIIWPAVLWGLGLDGPRGVIANGWITFNEEKMSKSKGNVVDPFEVAERFTPDAVRYFLLREAGFGQDFNFSEDAVLRRYHADLGNDLGNLLNRTLTMVEKYCGGSVPAPVDAAGLPVAALATSVAEAVPACGFRDALEEIWQLVTALNKLIDESKPWELRKRGETAALNACMYRLCEGLRWLAVLLHPFMPVKTAEMWRQLGLDGSPSQPWDAALRWGGLAEGTHVRKGEPLFPRLETALEGA